MEGNGPSLYITDAGDYKIVESHCVSNEEPMYLIHDVLNEELFQNLREEIKSIQLDQNSNDLSLFKQSENLEDLGNLTPAITRVLHFFKSNVRVTVERLFGLVTKPKITATVSKYSEGDYLLCHDDLFGTRAVAFVLYLSSLTEADGGSLRLFDLNEKNEPIAGSGIRYTMPEENTMCLFRVSSTSYHRVDQMMLNKDRWSINGWFHYVEPYTPDDVIEVPSVIHKAPILHLQMKVFPIMDPERILSYEFYSETNLHDMNTHLKQSQEKAIEFPGFLSSFFYNDCVKELESEIFWHEQGPANYRFYESLPFEVEGPHVNFGESFYFINNLIDLLLSEGFLRKIQRITNLEYVLHDENTVPPNCMIEVTRWREGHYSLLVDHDVERIQNTVTVSIYFKVAQHLLGCADDCTDLSGVVVQCVKPSQLNPDMEQRLHGLKLARMKNALMRESMTSKPSANLRNPRRRKKVSKARAHRVMKIHEIVQTKMDQIQSYRKSRPSGSYYLCPEDNMMILTIGSEQIMKYTSYIQKKTYNDPRVCYYAVTATYFTE